MKNKLYSADFTEKITRILCFALYIFLIAPEASFGLDSGTQVSILGGIELGGVLVSPTDADEETDKTGYVNRGYGMVSIFSESITFDAGLGAIYSKVKGKAKKNNVSDVIDQSEIAFTSGLFTGSVRWRLIPGIEIGPSLDITFGTDASYSPDVKAKDDPVAMIGVQLTKVWTDEETYDFRANFRVMTDLTVSARNILSFGLGVAMGIPLIKPDIIVKEKIKTRTKIKTRVKTVDKIVYQPVYVFQSDAINFEYNKAILLKGSKKFLSEVAGYLAENLGVWERLVIEGHTDKTGDLEYNMKLSQDRADAVAAVLFEQGVPTDRITTEGFGPSIPLVEGSDSYALAKNRRVELKFEGEMDQMKLGSGLDLIRRRNSKPDTCNNRDNCR